MTVVSLLGRLVIIRTDLERAVGAVGSIVTVVVSLGVLMPQPLLLVKQ